MQIDPQVFDSYYNGCCNATFWPLFHSMPDRATFKGQHWNSYTIANKEFANCTLRALTELLESGDKIGTEPPLIWIHDYHLMLAANWIRQVKFYCLLVKASYPIGFRQRKNKIYLVN